MSICKISGLCNICESSFLCGDSALGWWCDKYSPPSRPRETGIQTEYNGNFKTFKIAMDSLLKHIQKLEKDSNFEVVGSGLLLHGKNMDPYDTGLSISLSLPRKETYQCWHCGNIS